MLQHSGTISDAGAGHRQHFFPEQHQFAESNLSAHNVGFGSTHPQSQDTPQLLHGLLSQNKMQQQLEHIPLLGGLTGLSQHISRDQIWLTNQQHGAGFDRTEPPPPPPPPPREIGPSDPARVLSYHQHQHVNFGTSHPLVRAHDDDTNHTAVAASVPWIFPPTSPLRVIPDDQPRYDDFQPPLDQLQPLPYSSEDTTAPPGDKTMTTSQEEKDECSSCQ